MFKKILAVALAVLMCATMVVAFASCAKDDETEKRRDQIRGCDHSQ